MNEHWLETYRSLIKLSTEGFKFSALINGGAAVALLAYLGQLAGKQAPVPDMQFPMGAFLTGLALCGFSIFAGYLTQLKLLNELSQQTKPSLPHGWLLWPAIGLFFLSLVAFIVGALTAVLHFR